MEIHRFRAPVTAAHEGPARGYCVGGDCVWRRWARRSDDAHDTERARALRAYLADLAADCRCPRRRFERGH